jgi:2-dehydro-3-deoxyphosphogluconate aldolase / (4S)-4-hydroxy-2-oxoglutarate aldolase
MMDTLIGESLTAVIDRIGAIGVIPVVEISDASLAEPLAETLLEANLSCVEVTLRTPAAEAALRRLTSSYRSRLLIGAGTVLSPEQVGRVVDAGAAFLVSPGVDPAVIASSQSVEVPIYPGVCTPSEISTAYRLGIRTMKFFPAEAAGGIPYLDAISAPFKEVRFIPTGGIGPTNLAGYLAHPSIVACAGSWIVPTELLNIRDFGRIRQLAIDAVECARLLRGGANL